MTQAPGVIVHAELPSAGDSAYAGIAPLGGSRFLATWYSSNTTADETWFLGLLGPSDIWQATIDLASLPAQTLLFQEAVGGCPRTTPQAQPCRRIRRHAPRR